MGSGRKTLPLDGVLVVDFAQGDGVGEGEDDGAGVEGGHQANDLLVEGVSDGAEAKEGSGLDVVDNIFELGQGEAIVVGAGEELLVLLEALAIGSNQALGVNSLSNCSQQPTT